jgi:hypothetical protein
MKFLDFLSTISSLEAQVVRSSKNLMKQATSKETRGSSSRTNIVHSISENGLRLGVRFRK